MNSFFRQLLFVMILGTYFSMLNGQKVYLTEALRNPFERTIFMDTICDSFRYTAFYMGSICPESDILVEFSVDTTKAKIFNSKTGSGYKMLPKDSYTMSLVSDTIEKGSISTHTGEVKVVGASGLKPFEKYLLTITVKIVEGEAVEDSEHSTIYYVIQAVPALGNIPQKQIGKLPGKIKSAFGFGGKYLVTVSDDMQLTSYRYTGDNLGNPVHVVGSEYLMNLDNIVNFKDHHLVGLNREVNGGQLWSFPISTDAEKILPMEKVFGTAGYADFSEIISLKNNLYCLSPLGELKIYPLTDSLEWKSNGFMSLVSGWNYPILFGYHNSLITIDEEGGMWKYTLFNNGQPGLPKKIGTGWKIYQKVVVVGDDLLCVDKEGAVWQTKFNSNGYWAL